MAEPAKHGDFCCFARRAVWGPQGGGGYSGYSCRYRKAAKQGDSRAQNNLGWMYQHAQGVPTDFAQAVHWCVLACVATHRRAGLGFNRAVPTAYSAMFDRLSRSLAHRADALSRCTLGL